MKRESIFLTVFLVILVANSFSALGVQRVEASETIYIRADGTIYPPTAPVSTSDNITYVLNENVSQVIVERDNIVFDGGFQWVGGLSMKNALVLPGRSNVTIENTQIWTLGTFVMGTYLADAGIYVNYSTEIRLINNNFTNNIIAVYLVFSNGTIFSGNNISIKTLTPMDTSQWSGISMAFTSGSVISDNSIIGCGVGIDLLSASGNVIFHNNLVNNTQQVNVNIDNSTNTWDDGYPSGGNYWSDYNGTDANQDGIGDTPYVIDANNTDHYPLMNIIPEFSTFLILPVSMIATMLAVIVYKRKIKISEVI